MDALDVCKKIFLIALPLAEQCASPISYINIEVSEDFCFSDDELWESFNKLRWDTDLSSSELCITRKPTTKQNATVVKVVSLSVFEDDGNNAPLILVDKNI